MARHNGSMVMNQHVCKSLYCTYRIKLAVPGNKGGKNVPTTVESSDFCLLSCFFTSVFHNNFFDDHYSMVTMVTFQSNWGPVEGTCHCDDIRTNQQTLQLLRRLVSIDIESSCCIGSQCPRDDLSWDNKVNMSSHNASTLLATVSYQISFMMIVYCWKQMFTSELRTHVLPDNLNNDFD